MRVLWVLVIAVIALAGCLNGIDNKTQDRTSVPTFPGHNSSVSAPHAASTGNETALSMLEQLQVRNILPDGQGRQFLVQDLNMGIHKVGPEGIIFLGEAPEIELTAAWSAEDSMYAYARKAPGGDTYQIVWVKGGETVTATAAGFPGALSFQGQSLYFMDAQGWQVFHWAEGPQLKAPLVLVGRANKKAWCHWSIAGPLCVGGYDDDHILLLRAGEPPVRITSKDNHPILGDAAFSLDGTIVAVSLGSRSAGAPALGRVVVAWLNEGGEPVRTRDLPILASQVGIDVRGRLVLSEFSPDGSGPAKLMARDLGTGQTTTLSERIAGPYVMSPDRKWLFLLPGWGNPAVQVVDLTLD